MHQTLQMGLALFSLCMWVNSMKDSERGLLPGPADLACERVGGLFRVFDLFIWFRVWYELFL